jgi:predicted DNA-binding transcriptional regulator AlpA
LVVASNVLAHNQCSEDYFMATPIVPEALRAAAVPPRRLIDAKEVGRILGCSWRHVMRLADQGALPWGYKLGSLRRWDLSEIEAFIASGCRPVCQAARAER